jgi:ligand-binding sensor domain-containing protein
VGDEVWFGVFNGGIKRVSRATKQLLGAYTHNPTDAESLPSNMVNALYRDRTGCVWVGTSEGGIAKLVRNPIQT